MPETDTTYVKLSGELAVTVSGNLLVPASFGASAGAPAAAAAIGGVNLGLGGMVSSRSSTLSPEGGRPAVTDRERVSQLQLEASRRIAHLAGGELSLRGAASFSTKTPEGSDPSRSRKGTIGLRYAHPLGPLKVKLDFSLYDTSQGGWHVGVVKLGLEEASPWRRQIELGDGFAVEATLAPSLSATAEPHWSAIIRRVLGRALSVEAPATVEASAAGAAEAGGAAGEAGAGAAAGAETAVGAGAGDVAAVAGGSALEAAGIIAAPLAVGAALVAMVHGAWRAGRHNADNARDVQRVIFYYCVGYARGMQGLPPRPGPGAGASAAAEGYAAGSSRRRELEVHGLTGARLTHELDRRDLYEEAFVNVSQSAYEAANRRIEGPNPEYARRILVTAIEDVRSGGYGYNDMGGHALVTRP